MKTIFSKILYFVFSFSLISLCFTGCNSDQQSEYTSLNEGKPEISERQQIPQKVLKVLEYVRTNHRAPDGYEGGRKFGNFEKLLPIFDQNGKKIKYKEWDVNPKIHGKNRGKERLVTSDSDQAWYTPDHYDSFIEIK